MVDLSAVASRQTAQGRPTTNRDVVINVRRDTEAPRRQVSADMRSASRGSSGAEALAKMFSDAAEGAQTLSGYLKEERDARDVSTVSQQMLAGNVDPELIKRSAAARKVYALGESQKQTYGFLSQLDENVDAALNDPANPADEQHVDELIQKSVREFALGEDGRPKDFGTAEANLRVAEMIRDHSIKLRTNAAKVIKEQVLEQALNTGVSNAVSGLQAGGPVDVEGFMKTLMPGTDRKAAKAALVDGLHEYALSVSETDPNRALATMDGLLSSKQADGKTSSLSPAELERLRQERRTMANQIESANERKERELHEKNADGLLDRFNRVSGTYPTVGEILELRRSNQIDASFAGSMIASIRSDHELNGSGTVSSGRGGGRGGSKDDDGDDDPPASANELLDAVFARRMTVGQASAVASQWAAQGRFGTGKDRYKRLADLRKNFGVVNSLDREERNAIKDDIEGWQADSLRRASALPTLQRKRAEKEIKDVSQRMTSRIVRGVGRGGADPRTLMDAGLGAASRVLGRKYNLR